MQYWVDGYNLMIRRRDRSTTRTLADERAQMIAWLGTLGRPIRVYFDAARVPGGVLEKSDTPRVTVVFTRHGTADDAMIEALRSGEPKTTTIVTNDRELRRRAHQLGATTLGVEKFMKDVMAATTPKPAPGQSGAGSTKIAEVLNRVPLDTDYWLKEMGLDDDWTPESEDETPPRT